MKVEIHRDVGLIVKPETEFEEQALRIMFTGEDFTLKAFHKHGVTSRDYTGVVIQTNKQEAN